MERYLTSPPSVASSVRNASTLPFPFLTFSLSSRSKSPILPSFTAPLPPEAHRTTIPESLSPISESRAMSPKPSQLDLTALNLQRSLPPTKGGSQLSTSRSHLSVSGRRSLERIDSASSVGSWKTISRSNSNAGGMISRSDSVSSNNGLLQTISHPMERKFVKYELIVSTSSDPP